METKTFEIVPVLNSNTGKYEVKNFADNKKIVEEFIARVSNAVVEINDEIAFKEVRANRTDVNKKLDAIASARKDINALLLGEFNAQLKDIEKSLKGCYKTLTDKIDAWNEKVKGADNTPHVITLVIKGYDNAVINQLREQALKLGLKAEIK